MFGHYQISHSKAIPSVLSLCPAELESVQGYMHKRQKNDSWDPFKVVEIQHDFKGVGVWRKNNENTPNK